MVDDSTKEIRNDGDPEVRQLADEICRAYIEYDHGRDYVLKVRICPHQFLYLWVLIYRCVDIKNSSLVLYIHHNMHIL